MSFIERAAFWSGRVGRHAIASAFGVSLGHAGQDLKRYQHLAPRNLRYDLSNACYRPTATFRPIYDATAPEAFLSALRFSANLEPIDRVRLFGTDDLSTAVVTTPPLLMERGVTGTVLRALSASSSLRVLYQSLQGVEPERRYLQPSGLLFTGRRWLLRGWDPGREAFRDFALARFIEADEGPPLELVPVDDAWNKYVVLRIAPARELSPAQAAIVAREYGMAEEVRGSWFLEYPARRAAFPYILDFLALRSDALPETDIRELELLNYDELRVHDRRGEGRKS